MNGYNPNHMVMNGHRKIHQITESSRNKPRIRTECGIHLHTVAYTQTEANCVVCSDTIAQREVVAE